MATKDSVVAVGVYDSEDAAISDYNAVERLYTDDLSVDALNAAVITRRANGRAEVLRRRERSALGPKDTERLVGHMSKAGLKSVGLDELDPGQTMLLVVAAGEAWQRYDLANQIVLTTGIRTYRVSVDPSVVFDETLVVA